MKNLFLIVLLAVSLTSCKKEFPSPDETRITHVVEVYYPGSTDTYYALGEITYSGDCISFLMIDPGNRNYSFEFETCLPHKIIR